MRDEVPPMNQDLFNVAFATLVAAFLITALPKAAELWRRRQRKRGDHPYQAPTTPATDERRSGLISNGRRTGERDENSTALRTAATTGQPFSSVGACEAADGRGLPVRSQHAPSNLAISASCLPQQSCQQRQAQRKSRIDPSILNSCAGSAPFIASPIHLESSPEFQAFLRKKGTGNGASYAHWIELCPALGTWRTGMQLSTAECLGIAKSCSRIHFECLCDMPQHSQDILTYRCPDV